MLSRRHQPRRQEVDRSGSHHARWRREAVRTAADMRETVQAVISGMTAASYCARDIFAMRLALEEAIVNAIKHGHHSDPKKTVRVRYQVDPARVLAQVRDQGTGFDPSQVPDPTAPKYLERPTGRGLFLMRHFMTRVHFNQRGNCVTLCLERLAQSGQRC